MADAICPCGAVVEQPKCGRRKFCQTCRPGRSNTHTRAAPKPLYAEPSDEVLTANRGWVELLDIKVGDMVFHPSGDPTRVQFVSDVIADSACYRVATTDGRTVVVDGEQPWQVTDKRRGVTRGSRGDYVKIFESRVLTTEQMVNGGVSRYLAGSRSTMTNGKRYRVNEYRFMLPQHNAIQLPEQHLPIDPYLFGAWLGDGSAAGGSLTTHVDDVEHWVHHVEMAGFTTNARKVAGKPNTWTVGITCDRGPNWRQRTFNGKLRKLGALHNKHIPPQYLVGSVQQRLAILQGLLDTDGHISPDKGVIEFCNTNGDLAAGVLFLARSLGWRPTMKEGRAKIYGRDCGPKYRICWTPKLVDGLNPFRMPRKADRVRAADCNAGRLTVTIKSITAVPSRPVRRIRVEANDGLFLAGRSLIVTHEHHVAKQLQLFVA